PYTTACERLKGCRGGGKCGKIASGKRKPKILDKGERVAKRVTLTEHRMRLPAWCSGLRVEYFSFNRARNKASSNSNAICTQRLSIHTGTDVQIGISNGRE
ncbi:MAG: hypothetical protein MJE68_06105, partial [Proteobacteria bacterium]|nr:hypothetical protein [Pseudomonadota bacterium]